MRKSLAEGLEGLAELFGDRFGRYTGPGDNRRVAVAWVLPMRAEEVQRLAEMARDYSLELVAAGGGTGPTVAASKRGVLVRFDLMHGVRLPDEDGDAIWAEPGVSWLQMDDELRMNGRGLAVYPTSAPRATVGGWLATDGLGVGSFEYGRLRENVLSASVVLPGGELCEVRGEELGDFIGPETGAGIIVGASIRTRRAHTDIPFAAILAHTEDVLEAVEELAGSSAPLWHLAFLNPAMAAARGLGEGQLLFGAYPNDRAEEVGASLERAVGARGARLLSAAEAHKAWGERFYPVTPSRPTPEVIREYVPLTELRRALDAQPDAAVQCVISRSGEALLLTLGAGATRDAP